MSAAIKENLQILFISITILSILSIGAYSIWSTSYAEAQLVKATEPQLPDEEQMMMYVLDKENDNVRVIGCPASQVRGPAIYVISDPAYAARVNPGEFTPVFFSRTSDETAFHFAGWLSKQENKEEE